MAPDFPALLAAIGPGRLREHQVERRLFHLKGVIDPVAAGLPAMAELEAALTEGRVRADQLELCGATIGIDLHALRLLDGDHVSPQVASLPRDRMVFIFTDLARILPRLAPFLRAAQAQLGESIRMGAIASWGHSSGLKPHYDSESLLLVQLAGVKRWRLFGAPAEGSGRKQHSSDPVDLPVSAELVMHPGDVLFVPAGLRHQCETDGFSLHLGIGIEHETGMSLAHRLLKIARDDAMLNEPLMRAEGIDTITARAEISRQRLHAMLDRIDLTELLDVRLAGRMRKRED